MALMTLIFFFVLSRFTFSIGKTISKLRDFALYVEKDRMPAVDYVFPNDELGDISQNIVTLYHRQQKANPSLEYWKCLISFSKATRAIYPLSSNIDRKKNNTTINGKNDKTLPTPAITPSRSSEISQGAT